MAWRRSFPLKRLHHRRTAKPPYLLRYRSSEAFITTTVALAIFTDMFLYSLLVPILPFSLSSRAHIPPYSTQHWVSVLVAIYAAALLALSPLCGWIADRWASRRTALLAGLGALLGATVLLHVGRSVGVLVAGRVLQGASAAVVWVVGLALLADTIPQERLGQAMGYVGAGMSVGILVGPLLGGVVFDRAGYDAVFAMAYALVGVDIVLRVLVVEKKVAERWMTEHHDSNEERASAPREPSDAVEKGMEARAVAADAELGTPSAPPAQRDSNRLRDRLPPVLSLLYSRRLLAALYGSAMQAAIMTSFDSVLALHAASTFGWTSTGAALLFLPIVIPSFLGPVFGSLSDRYGGRPFATLGFLLACPPLVCLRFVDTDTLRDKVLLCVLLALVGMSLTLTFPPFMAEISAVVEEKERKMVARGRRGYGVGGAYGQAYGLFNMAFAVGCVVGPLLAGFIVQEKGWATMAWVVGLLAATTAVPTFLWLGGYVFAKRELGT